MREIFKVIYKVLCGKICFLFSKFIIIPNPEQEREGGKQGWMEGEENRPLCGESLVEVLIGNRLFKLWTSVILKNYKRKELEISRVKSLNIS